MRTATAKKTTKNLYDINYHHTFFADLHWLKRSFLDKVYVNIRKALNLVSAFVLGVTIRRAVSKSVHREGVNPNSMEGVHDLIDHIDVVTNTLYHILSAISTHDIRKEVTRSLQEPSKDSLKVNTISMPIQTFKDVEFKL